MSKAFVAVSIITVILFAAVVLLFQSPGTRSEAQEISYSQFLTMGARVRDVVIRGTELSGHDTERHSFFVVVPNDPALPTRLAQAGMNVTIGPPADNQSWLVTLLINLVPLVIFYLIFAMPMRRLAKAVESLAIAPTLERRS